MFEKGDYIKHYKGELLKDKNVYKVIDVRSNGFENISKNHIGKLVVYQDICSGQIFTKDQSELDSVVSLENQKKYGQVHKMEKMTEFEKILVDNKNRFNLN